MLTLVASKRDRLDSVCDMNRWVVVIHKSSTLLDLNMSVSQFAVHMFSVEKVHIISETENKQVWYHPLFVLRIGYTSYDVLTL